MKIRVASVKFDDWYRWCSLCEDYYIIGQHPHEAHNKLARKYQTRMTGILLTFIFAFFALIIILFVYLLYNAIVL